MFHGVELHISCINGEDYIVTMMLCIHRLFEQ